ncbi:BON domain-containing protein [Methylosoma difficile]
MKSDTQLQTDVIDELNFEPSINAAQIGVVAKNGIVTLSGCVNTYSEKWNAERATLRVSGVKALAVEMEVTLLGLSKRTDTDIARAAESVLEWTSFLPNKSVKLMVEDGWITISGEVDWDYQREAAADAVRYLMGVTGVSNNVTIKAKVASEVIKTDIEAALKRRASRDAQAIVVEVQGNNVTLSGKVHSWSERDLATHSAWCSPGVHNVKDKMVIS